MYLILPKYVYLFLSQICPQPADVVEIIIYLGEPCHVCQLLLTISHGADDSTYPSTVDVRTGRHLDGLKLVLEVCILSSLCLTTHNVHVCIILQNSWSQSCYLSRKKSCCAHLCCVQCKTF